MRMLKRIGLIALALMLGVAALAVYGQHLFYGFTCTLEVLLLQAADHALGILCNEFEC